MTFLRERIFRGKKYLYLEKSLRIGKKVIKLSRFLGRKESFPKEKLNEEIKLFSLEINEKTLNEKMKFLRKSIKKTEYPLTFEEIKKIEIMLLRYKEIMKNLRKEDISDIKKRFIANFVFESNAIEGNSLTLKNYDEIIFENRISKGADLREVYDAKNSYETFSWLLKARRNIDEKLIIEIHKKIMKNIDFRIGYKTVPNIILGSTIKLSPPENVKTDMRNLIEWYNKNKEFLYPLELALKFHHRFERIHPFSDGNGRVGRMLLNYILLKSGYFPIIIRKTQRNKYIKSLQEADIQRFILLVRFGLEKCKETYRKFFEVYYKYAKKS